MSEKIEMKISNDHHNLFEEKPKKVNVLSTEEINKLLSE